MKFINKDSRENLSFIKKIMPKHLLFSFIKSGILFSFLYIFSFIIPLLQKRFIDFSINEKTLLNRFFYLLVSFIFFELIFTYISKLYTANLHSKIVHFLSNFIFVKIVNLSKNNINNIGVGYLNDIILRDTVIASRIFNNNFFDFIFSLIRSIAIFIAIFKWDITIFFILIATSIFLFVFSLVYKQYDLKIWTKQRNIESKFANTIIDFISNSTAIKNFLVINKISYLFEKRRRKILDINLKYNKFSRTGSVIYESTKTIALLLMVIFSIKAIISGKLSYGSFFAMFAYFNMAFTPIDGFHSFLRIFISTETGIKRLREITAKSTNSAQTLLPNRMEKPAIVFDHVNFAYNNKNILQDLTIEIKNKERIGIVGLSGIGKSTIIDLLLNEKIPNSGKILFNEIPIDKLSGIIYHFLINYFGQNIEIFDNDLIFNITLNKKVISHIEIKNIKKKISDELIKIFISITENINKPKKIKKILERIKADFIIVMEFYNDLQNPGFVKNLLNNPFLLNLFTDIEFSSSYVIKEKLDTVIQKLNLYSLMNRNFGERGAFISGGEKQKVAFARFLLKEGYEFFILDEPFTNLDAITEKELLDVATELLKDKTGIVISHKFNILHKLTNKIIVLEEGKISGKGTHIELLEKNPLYKKIFEEYKKQKDL